MMLRKASPDPLLTPTAATAEPFVEGERSFASPSQTRFVGAAVSTKHSYETSWGAVRLRERGGPWKLFASRVASSHS